MGYLCLFLLIIVHGIREGFTWADNEERHNNIFITNHIGEGIAKIDYHGWRSIEYILILGVGMFGARLIPAIAVFMMAQLPYNGILHKICTGKFWYERTCDFPWMGITIKKQWLTWKTDILLGFIGIALFLGSMGK